MYRRQIRRIDVAVGVYGNAMSVSIICDQQKNEYSF